LRSTKCNTASRPALAATRTDAASWHPRRQGFTLLEVLIALLVLSIGLLGLAALQTTGLRSSQMAIMRTQAAGLASDIVECMHANPAGVARGEYVMERTAPVVATPASRAEQDLVAWRRQVARLPGGQGEITRCSPATEPPCPLIDGRATHVVTIYWNESRNPDAGAFHCPPRTDGDYRCLRLVTQ